ncbi:hypothetical protein [Lactococcus fujiensis]|uniref:Uncharacterized protein n=1 Tax=Lactococcus fujiensis JCM 16395 TaxID=1291764 RepID=A0A2A5RPY1_9LACT|nr:hypothetical protein [Lactococcus fujiensis]PCS01497.1 hypothetical protein RT41_GL000261 [Lactococcus fujiensis JCM 16395]
MSSNYFASHREELFEHIKDIQKPSHVFNVLEFMLIELGLHEEVAIYSKYLDIKYTRDYQKELEKLLKN